ncbi:hypothetical protein FDF12_01315 [Clostridium botulinum]|nr:hypothetical protein [Clostridium botulinum]NFS53490.1 hypothetical protein [Clostridium botulinum]NFT16060.1 hypothetical protein [Clostridium botulinum]
MKLTSNYSLKKPDGSDVVNVQDFNDNSDKIDIELKKVDSQLKEIKNNLGDSVKKDGRLQTNLNADLLDGKHANDFATSNHNHNIISGNNTCSLKLGSTGTNDCSGTSKTNNIDIASWYGVSFSNSCSGAGIQGKPSASIDVRSGNMFLDGDIYLKGQSTGLFQSVSNGKSAIANAITGNGGQANTTDTFEQLANKITNLNSIDFNKVVLTRDFSMFKDFLFFKDNNSFYFRSEDEKVHLYSINNNTITSLNKYCHGNIDFIYMEDNKFLIYPFIYDMNFNHLGTVNTNAITDKYFQGCTMKNGIVYIATIYDTDNEGRGFKFYRCSPNYSTVEHIYSYSYGDASKKAWIEFLNESKGCLFFAINISNNKGWDYRLCRLDLNTKKIYTEKNGSGGVFHTSLQNKGILYNEENTHYASNKGFILLNVDLNVHEEIFNYAYSHSGGAMYLKTLRPNMKICYESILGSIVDLETGFIRFNCKNKIIAKRDDFVITSKSFFCFVEVNTTTKAKTLTIRKL